MKQLSALRATRVPQLGQRRSAIVGVMRSCAIVEIIAQEGGFGAIEKLKKERGHRSFCPPSYFFSTRANDRYAQQKILLTRQRQEVRDEVGQLLGA